MGPFKKVNRYSGCIVNGYRFHTQSREKNRKTQNSGVVVKGEHGNNVIDYYGVLQDVIEVEYLGANNRVLIFQCDWFNLNDSNGMRCDTECELVSVNKSRKWYVDDPYILASQARQVFYAIDLRHGGNWHVVHHISPRALYDVPEHEGASEVEEVYQEEEPTINLVVDLNMDVPNLTRGATALQLLDSSIIGAARNIGPSRNFRVVDEAFIDDEEIEMSHSHSSTEDEELLQDDSSDSE